jgi:O-antigen ligase
MGVYLAIVLFSAFQAAVPLPVFFYAWQLARAFLMYVVISKACSDQRVAPSLLKGMAIGLCFEAGSVIWERVGLGVIQTTGTFGHQNLLGMASHFVIFPFFALLLAGERGWWPVTTPLAGGIIAALTASRATIGLVSLGLAVVFVFSATRRWTPQLTRVVLWGTAAIAVLSSLALSSLGERFAVEPLTAYDERAALVSASAMMLADRPMGVGANNFVIVNNTGGYAVRADVDLAGRSALVHNIYWLTLAEMGYPGLVALLLLLSSPLTVALRCSWRNPRDQRVGLMIGLATALLIIYIHSYFEWVFFTIQIQYLFATTVGLIAGLAHDMGYWRPRKAQVFGVVRIPGHADA